MPGRSIIYIEISVLPSKLNVLYDGEPVVIDMGQSVTLEHPMAAKFLARDIANIARYFEKKYGIGSEEEIWSKVKAL